MKITKVTVHAGRTYPHPFIHFANLRPGVSMTAVLANNDDVNETIRTLQALAEAHVEQDLYALRYAISMVKEVEMADANNIAKQLIATVELMKLIKTGQMKVEQLKRQFPDLIEQMTVNPRGEYAPGSSEWDDGYDDNDEDHDIND